MQTLSVVEERQRIGMDLRDGVIQSIYAVGLTLRPREGSVGRRRRRQRRRTPSTRPLTRSTARSAIFAPTSSTCARRGSRNDDLNGAFNRLLLAEFKANTFDAELTFGSKPERSTS